MYPFNLQNVTLTPTVFLCVLQSSPNLPITLLLFPIISSPSAARYLLSERTSRPQERAFISIKSRVAYAKDVDVGFCAGVSACACVPVCVRFYQTTQWRRRQSRRWSCLACLLLLFYDPLQGPFGCKDAGYSARERRTARLRFREMK